MKQYRGAIKFLFTSCLKQGFDVDFLPPVKKEKKLPITLTSDEVFAILKNASNLKHKALLTIAYSSGLRVSEASRIRFTDINRKMMKLRVNLGKGAKDRITILSEVCLKVLEKYWKYYRPDTFLFPGRDKTKPMTIRACQHAFYKAKAQARITKPCGFHSLRHSFATHFLEIGGGIFQLQKLMGHKQLRTTMVYIHLQEEKTICKSPLDVYGRTKNN